MASETVNAFTTRISPISFKRHEQARVSVDTGFRRASNWNVAIEPNRMGQAERQAHMALRDSQHGRSARHYR